MKIWGIAFILLGGGGILAAVFNWDAWFRISSAGGHLVHDAFGRKFARMLNVAVGIPLLVLGIADVTGQLPVSQFMHAWLSDDRAYFESLAGSAATDARQVPVDKEAAAGLRSYSP